MAPNVRAIRGGGIASALNYTLPPLGQGATNSPGVSGMGIVDNNGGYGNGGLPGIVTGGGADWFGPGNPLRPVAPQDVRGRSFDLRPAYNLVPQPRAFEAIDFPMLRGLAQNYDVLATVIETRKDQMAALTWSPVPIEGTKPTPDQARRITKIKAFFKKPAPRKKWSTWLRKLIDDLLVIDAPTVYPRLTLGGDLCELRIFDGAMMKPLIDDWGEPPEQPYPCYQQTLKGLPAVYYGRDPVAEEGGYPHLYYLPRNQRPGRIMGFSPVEQIVTIINIAIRRELWQLKFFTEGTVPDMLLSTPAEWTPDQVRSFQDWWDSVQLTGTAGKRGVRFVPGGVGKEAVNIKESELFGAAEEWLARVICFAFSISPQAFVKMQNRATAESQKEIAIEEGLEPLKCWVKEFIDDVLEDYFDSPDLQLQWDEEEEIDQQSKATMLENEAKAGLISIDEARTDLGRDPLGGDFATPMAYTTMQGYMPISIDDQIAQQKKKIAGGIMRDPNEPPPMPAGGLPGAGGGPPGGDQEGGQGAGGGKTPPKGGKGAGGKQAAGNKAKKNDPGTDDPDNPLSDSFAKYSDSQERDEHGRWTSGGAGESQPAANAGASGTTSGGASFASPSTTDKNLGEAVAALSSDRQEAFENASRDIDAQLGIQGADQGVVGAWKDGAENSTMLTSDSASLDQLRASAAMKGMLGDQKAVLVFGRDPNGHDVFYSGHASGAVADIHQQLLDAGIENHSLAPTNGGAKVYIADLGGSSAAQIAGYADKAGVDFTAERGTGEFIGATHYDGTSDAEQRAEGRSAYQAVIAGSSITTHQGDRASDVWGRVRDRWAGRLEALKSVAWASSLLKGTPGLYVRRDLTPESAAEFAAWATSQGFTNLTPTDELHATIVYSRSPVELEPEGGEITAIGGERVVKPLGDKGAVVLRFESPALADRWARTIEAGAAWDYPGYQPHVTITYDGTNVDLGAVTPFQGALTFGPEVHEPLIEEWQPPVAKYKDDQPRDEKGQWASSGASTVSVKDLKTFATNWISGKWNSYQRVARDLINGKAQGEGESEASDKDREKVQAILDKINSDGSKLDYPLYRGILADKYKKGDTFSESLSTWTSDEMLADQFAHGQFEHTADIGHGDTGMVLTMKGSDMRGFNISNLDREHDDRPFRVFTAEEHITSGQYHVDSIKKVGGLRYVNVTRIGPAQADDLAKGDEAVALRKREAPPERVAHHHIPVERPLAQQAQTRLQARIFAAFRKCATDVRSQIVDQLDKMAKAGPGDPNDPDKIVKHLDLSALDAIADGDDDLYDVASDSGAQAIAGIGPQDASDLVDQVNPLARDWALLRAAELVGKRRLEDGRLIDNPRAEYSILQATRDKVRGIIGDGLAANIGTPAIADKIVQVTTEPGKENPPFSEDRASLVARTEISRANEQGKLIGYRQVRDSGVAMGKSWLTMGEACDDCQDNEDEGVIGLDEDFPSGDDAPPGHPNCRCVLIPEVLDDESGGDDGGDDDE